MKNVIIVDIDTDRVPVVKIGKNSELPKNKEEAKDIIIKDIACLTEALCSLINAADTSGYKSAQDSLNDTVVHLERGIIPPDAVIPSTEEEK